MPELKKKDVRDIVNDELDKFVNRRFKDEVANQLKMGTKGRKEVLDIVKNALEELYKYMWIRRSIWKSEIR